MRCASGLAADSLLGLGRVHVFEQLRVEDALVEVELLDAPALIGADGFDGVDADAGEMAIVLEGLERRDVAVTSTRWVSM